MTSCSCPLKQIKQSLFLNIILKKFTNRLVLTLPVNWSRVRMVSTAMGVPSRPTSRLALSKLVMSQTTGPRWKMTGSSSGLVETAETYSVGA